MIITILMINKLILLVCLNKTVYFNLMKVNKESFETFLIKSIPSRWVSSEKKDSTIDAKDNVLYFVPPSFNSHNIDSLRAKFSTLEVSNLLKLLPSKDIKGRWLRMSGPTINETEKIITFSVLVENKAVLMFQKEIDTDMFSIKCPRPYLLEWKLYFSLSSILTVKKKNNPVYEILAGKVPETDLRTTLGSNHPYCTFGKYEFKKVFDSCIKKQLESTAYSKSGIYYHQAQKSKTTLSEDDLKDFPGLFKFKYIEDKKYTIKYNNKNVHSMVFLDYRCEKVVEKSNYIELDCSFFVIDPYVYCIPLGIVNNESFPLGLSIGPSESLEIYDQFYALFKQKYPTIKIEKLPLLSDEGTALKALSAKYNILHFFCYRHLINKFGASTQLGNIVRELLFSFSEAEFKEKLNLYDKAIKQILRPTSSHLRQFQNLFNVSIYPDIPIKKYIEQGLWYRRKFNVGTCSNHIESCHQKLNLRVMSKSKNINEHFLCILQYISKKFDNEPKSRNAHDAIKSIQKIKNTHNIGECDEHCHDVRNFYSALYGFDFPCVHNIDEFKESEIKKISKITAEEFFKVEGEEIHDPEWKFSDEKDKIEFKLSLDEIQWRIENPPSWKAISYCRIFFTDYIKKKADVKQFILNSFVHFSFNVFGKYCYEDDYVQLYNDYLIKLVNKENVDEYIMKWKIYSQKNGIWQKPIIPQVNDSNIITEVDSYQNRIFENEIIDIIHHKETEKQIIDNAIETEAKTRNKNFKKAKKSLTQLYHNYKQMNGYGFGSNITVSSDPPKPFQDKIEFKCNPLPHEPITITLLNNREHSTFGLNRLKLADLPYYYLSSCHLIKIIDPQDITYVYVPLIRHDAHENEVKLLQSCYVATRAKYIINGEQEQFVLRQLHINIGNYLISCYTFVDDQSSELLKIEESDLYSKSFLFIDKMELEQKQKISFYESRMIYSFNHGDYQDFECFAICLIEAYHKLGFNEHSPDICSNIILSLCDHDSLSSSIYVLLEPLHENEMIAFVHKIWQEYQSKEIKNVKRLLAGANTNQKIIMSPKIRKLKKVISEKKKQEKEDEELEFFRSFMI